MGTSPRAAKGSATHLNLGECSGLLTAAAVALVFRLGCDSGIISYTEVVPGPGQKTERSSQV